MSVTAAAGARTIVFRAFSVLLGLTFPLVLAELVLRVIFPAPSGYFAMTPNLKATFSAQLHAKGVGGAAVFKVNSMGFRSREWSTNRASEYRIICLGGSTTESLLNDQDRIWTTLLENRLGQLPDGRRTWVGNMGKAGLASKHHLVQLKHLDLYDPDLIVLLVGSSDFMSRLKLGDSNPTLADQSEDERTLEEQAFAALPDEFLWDQPFTWYRSTRLWRRMSVLFGRSVLSGSEKQDQYGLSLESWRAMRAGGKRSDKLPPLETSLDSYERTLRQIVSIAQNSGAPIVLMTQPSIWRAGLTDEEKGQLWMGGVGDFRDVPGSLYYEPEALERGIDAYNQRLLQVCRDTTAHCIDLAKTVPKSTDYFYDDEHFTDRGQAFVAERVAEGVLDVLRHR
jgi:GDSL-like lipase/acylhydrolase family protein